MYEKGNNHIRLSNNPFYFFSLKKTTININFFTRKNQSEYLQKMLTNNNTVSLHRHHPKKTRQYLQLPKTPKHPHEFLSKITHTLLKNDTLAYPNH